MVGSSSFGWWAAYLAKVPLGYVVAPRYLYNRSLPRHHPNYPMLKGFRETDYFPTDWRLLENDGMLRPGWGWADPPPPPPPPKPLVSTPCARPQQQHRCFLRIRGACPGYERPQYRSWWPAGGGLKATSRPMCAQKQQAWQRMCGRGGYVEMEMCDP